MLDLKTMKSALDQLEQERKIPREKIVDAIEQALAAAYKKDYGKKGQIIRAKIDLETGTMEFNQIKIAVDESLVRMTKEDDEEEEIAEDDDRVRFNEEHHILLEDAKKIKSDVQLKEEIVFPLENQSDYGRIAAQTAKQVIIQKIREAERTAIVDEYGSKEGEIINGIVQKVDRGIVYIDFNRATGIILPEEQIPGEFYRHGERIKAYLYSIEETPRGVNLKLSRTHPQLIEGLFAMEAPEIASGVVEIKAIAREAGARSKIAVYSNDEHVDPVGSCVGQKGSRVTTVMSELNGEKIDIIPWSADPVAYISSAISPATVLKIEVSAEEHKATVEVAMEQLSLAIGKGGQNVRLAAKLTGWRIDIKGMEALGIKNSDGLSEDDILDGGIVDDGTEDK
ncbi:MAG: transcription termination factor NusA [Candidatus Nomurabacteria bacterium]|nr:transcription termination factor NusA [Candidatus Nomurabacteria bacterium]